MNRFRGRHATTDKEPGIIDREAVKTVVQEVMKDVRARDDEGSTLSAQVDADWTTKTWILEWPYRELDTMRYYLIMGGSPIQSPIILTDMAKKRTNKMQLMECPTIIQHNGKYIGSVMAASG